MICGSSKPLIFLFGPMVTCTAGIRYVFYRLLAPYKLKKM